MKQAYSAEELIDTDTGQIAILIVDDHPVSSEGVTNYLETDPLIKVVSTWQRGEDAIEAISHSMPDLVIVDLELTGSQINGVEMIRILRRRYPHLRLLALSAYSDQNRVLGAVEAGVNGYLLKTSSRVELINAVHTLINGQTLFDPNVIKVLQLYTRSGMREIVDPEPLTEREWEVLDCLAKEYSNREIAAHLTIAPSTVKTHVKNIFSKLNLSNREQARVWYYMYGDHDLT